MSEAVVERVVLIVCDSWGVGDAPDAAAYGDGGSDTLGNTARAVGGIAAPNLARLGLGHLTEIAGVPPAAAPGTAHGRATERSAGKDTTTGHWEMMGLVLDRPFPLYPTGFPAEVIEPFERAIGRRVLGNRPASGTEIIEELGATHLATGRPIVYTSGDSVFQVAAHVDVVDLPTLYTWCEIARGLLVGEHAVGRVIARPFEGRPGAFVRRPERRDLSLPPPGPTVLDRLEDAGVPVLAVGKIADVFAGRGIAESRYSNSDEHGVELTLERLDRPGPVLVFTNLVDFDSKYGHRNDPQGYARAVEAFDRRIPELLDALGAGVLVITGDHGCDPTTPSTDHSRERTPILIGGLDGGPHELGTRSSFADLGVTIGTLLGARVDGLAGTSFADSLGIARRRR
ncbi:MAG: phosphopentomutase [Actinomycetota bacterium]|nr:MAG: phosphopentomutase [Actinomycetota bacterium]